MLADASDIRLEGISSVTRFFRATRKCFWPMQCN